MTTRERKDVLRYCVQCAFYIAVACLVAFVCSVGGAWEQVGP